MKQLYYLFICLFLAFVSCKNDESEEVIDSQPVTFTVGAESRATQDGTFEKGNSIGVFAYDSKKQIFSATNAKYIYDGSAFNAAAQSDIIFVTEGTDLDFYVYYPYDPNSKDPHKITHAASNQSDKAGWIAADFLTATYTEPVHNHTVRLDFKHRFSTLQVKADKSDGVKGASIQGVKTTATFDLLKGTGTVSPATANLGMYLHKQVGGMKYYRVTIPAQLIETTRNFVIQSNVDGSSVKLRGTENISMQEGKVHNMYVSSKRGIVVNDYLPGGTTQGAGEYTLGSTCQLLAQPKGGYEFIGWFEKGNLVDARVNYGFKVTEDRIFDVKYRSYGAWDIVFNATGNPIPPMGGKADITATAKRDILENGTKTGTQEDHNVKLSIKEPVPGFSIKGNSVTASENTSLNDREVVITGTVGTGTAQKEVEYIVKQTGGEQTYGDWFITLDATPKDIPASGGEATITGVAKREIIINGQATGRYEEKTPQITITSGGPVFSLAGNKLKVGNNTTASQRNATLTATLEGCQPQTVTVVQKAGVKSFGNWGVWTTNSIKASASPSQFGINGGTSTLTATASQTHTRDILWNGIKTDSESQTVNNDVTSSATWTGGAAGFSRSGSTVTVSKNLATRGRSATYTATYDSKTAQCTINQSGGDEKPGAWQITISAQPSTIPAKGGSSTITASAKRDITINGEVVRTESGDVTLSSSNSAFGLSGNTVTVGNNTTASQRSTTVTAKIGGVSKSVAVTQSAGKKTYGTPTSWSTSSLTVTASSSTIPASGGSSNFTATASQTRTKDVLWNGIKTGTETETQNANVTSSATWSGSATGFTRSGSSVSAGNNKTTSSRSITVTGSYGGYSNNATVTQSAGNKTIGPWTSWSTSSLTVTASSLTIAASGGSSTFKATASQSRTRDISWNGVYDSTETETRDNDVTSSATWSGSATGFTRSGSSVSAGNNKTTSSRSITVTGSYGGYSKNVTVTQSAGNKTIGPWTSWSTSSLTASANPSSIGESGGTSYLSASAKQTRTRDISWNGVYDSTETETQNANVTSSATWSGSATGFSRSGSTVTVSANPNENTRSVTYTATYGGKKATCSISQDAHNVSVTYGTWSVTITASPTSFDEGGGSGRITASASRSVKHDGVHHHYEEKTPSVSSNTSWCSVSGSSFSVSSNSSTSSRSARITATYGGQSDYVTISQDAHSPVISYGAWNVSITASPTSFGEGGGSGSITASASRSVYVDGSYSRTETGTPSVSSNTSWCSVSGSSFSVSSNSSTSARSARITATYGGQSDYVTISQAAHIANITYEFSVSPTTAAFSSSGGSKTHTVTSKKYSDGSLVDSSVGYSVSSAPSWCSFSGGTLSVTENTGSNRSGTVTLKQNGSGKTVSISVQQRGKYNVDIN